MAETGRPGGREGLETKRVRGPIHGRPPEVGPAALSLEANASKQPGVANTNRIATVSKGGI